MRVAAWQFDVVRDDVAANLSAVARGLELAARSEVELLVLPEMWPTSFLSAWGAEDPAAELAPAVAASVEAVESAAARAAELGLALAGSAYAPGPVGAPPFNRLTLHADGRELVRYDKTHLFTLTAEHLGFSAGDGPPPVVDLPRRAGGSLQVSGCICYDLRFAPVLEAARGAGAELVVVPAQWPTPRVAHFEALLHGRAVETQAALLGANRVGVELVGRRRARLDFCGGSRVVGPEGVALAEAAGVGEQLVVADVDPEPLRELRKQVRVLQDRRPEVYRGWPVDRRGGAPGL